MRHKRAGTQYFDDSNKILSRIQLPRFHQTQIILNSLNFQYSLLRHHRISFKVKDCEKSEADPALLLEGRA